MERYHFGHKTRRQSKKRRSEVEPMYVKATLRISQHKSSLQNNATVGFGRLISQRLEIDSSFRHLYSTD